MFKSILVASFGAAALTSMLLGGAAQLGDEDAGFAEVEDGSLVAAGLDALDERERRIVELRFFEEKTQSQIAAEVGISQMHVSRLLRSALATMRGRIEEVATRDV